MLYIVELTVGYESNLESNIRRKNIKYKELIKQQRKSFNDIKFVNISISSLGVFAKESSNFLTMLDDIGFEDKHKIYCIRKMMTIDPSKVSDAILEGVQNCWGERAVSYFRHIILYWVNQCIVWKFGWFSDKT